MGKRKHRRCSEEHIRKKIRRLEKRLCRYHSSDSNEEYEDRRPASPCASSEVSDVDPPTSGRLQSVVATVHAEPDRIEQTPLELIESVEGPIDLPTNEPIPISTEVTPSTSAEHTAPLSLPIDILEALGEAKGKPEVFGPKIQEEVSKRWGRILSEGLNKDQKKAIMDRILVPENFTLVKAPKLNPEISAVLTDSARNRDKRLEKAQQHLGIGIAGLTSTISSLIDGEIDKLELIKKLSEVNQTLLDLHFENTINRRKLIIPTLDKKFLSIIQDVQRDSLLFGEGLGDKIKASKTAEKSGLQIKKPEPRESHAPKKYPAQQGNWKSLPRQAQRGGKQYVARNRSSYQNLRKTGRAPSDNYRSTAKPAHKSTTKQQ